MALKFEITGDNSNLLSSLEGARSGVHRAAQDIEQTGLGVEQMFQRIASVAGVAFSLDQAKSFVNKISEVRAYFQDIESSMEVFLGSEKKAAEFTDKLKDYAYYNMFEFSDLANASKQMISYGHAIDDIIPRLDQLSNIATGTNADLMELVNLYNNAKNLGSVGSQGLQSWAVRGVVVKDVLKEIGEEVKGTTVTFDQLNKVLDHVTGEGGMFHELMLNQMENISAEQGQLEDNLAAMYNEIGEKYQDYITGAIKAQSYLVEHYKEVGTVLLSLIASYGVYKATLVAVKALENVQRNNNANTQLKALQAEIDKYKELMQARDDSRLKTLEEAQAKGQLSEQQEQYLEQLREEIDLRKQVEAGLITQDQADAIKAKSEELALLMNSYGADDSALKEQIDSLQKEIDTGNELLNIYREETGLQDLSIQTAEEAVKVAKDKVEYAQQYVDLLEGAEEGSTSEYAEALDMLNQAVEEQAAAENVLTLAKQAEGVQTEVNTLQDKMNGLQRQRTSLNIGAETAAISSNSVAMRINAIAGTALNKASKLVELGLIGMRNAFNSMKVAFMTNPIGMLVGALTLLYPLLDKFVFKSGEAADETERFNESIDKEVSKIKSLYSTYSAVGKSGKIAKDTTKELASIAKEYGITLSEEAEKEGNEIRLQEELVAKKEDLIDAIRRETIEREHANEASSIEKDYSDAIDEARKNLKTELSKYLGSAGAAQAVTIISDEDIETLGEYQQAVMNTTKGTIDHTAALMAYREEQENILNKVRIYVGELGKVNGKSGEYFDNIENIISASREFTAVTSNSNGEMRNADVALSKATLTAMGYISQQKEATVTAEQLSARTASLINLWNQTAVLKLKIHYDDSEIPQWMKGLSDEQLKKSIIARQNFMYSTQGKGNVKMDYGGNVKNKGQVGRELGMLQQVQDERAEMNKPHTTSSPVSTTDKKKKTTKSSGKKVDVKSLTKDWKEDLEDFAENIVKDTKDLTIENLEESTEKVLKKIDQEEKKELEALEKSRKNLIKKTQEYNKKIGKGEFSDEAAWKQILEQQPGLQEDIEKNRLAIVEKYKQQRDEAYKEEMQSFVDYANMYGSGLQKIIAVEKERQIRLDKASNEWERKSINKEYDQKTQGVKADEMLKSIDWVQMFKGVGSMTKGMAEQMRTQITDLVMSDNFKTLDPQIQEKLVSTLDGLREKLGSDTSVSWEQAGQLTQDFMNAQFAYENAKQQEAIQGDLVKDIERQLENETDEGKKSELKVELELAKGELNQFSDNVITARDNMNALGQQVNYVTNELENYSNALSAQIMESELGGLEGASGVAGDFESLGGLLEKADKVATEQKANGQGSGFMSAVSGAGGIVDSITNALTGGIGEMIMDMIGIVAKIPQLIMSFAKNLGSMVTGILDGFTEFLKFEWLQDVILSITSSVTSLIEAIFKLPENLGHVVMNIVKEGIGAMIGSIIETMLSAVGLGDFGPDSWFGNGAKIAKEIAKLESRNEKLIEAIDTLRESFDSANGIQLIERYDQAIRMQKELERNNQKIIALQMAYTHSHSSWAKEWGGFDKVTARYLAQQLGKDENWRGTVAELKALTADEWQVVKGNADAWDKITSTGKGGYGERVGEKIETAIEQAGKLQELVDSLNQSLTQISFDDLFNSFVDTLSDMDSSAKDFAESFEEYMKKAVINSMAEEYRDRLKVWYEDFAAAMKANSITEIKFDGRTFNTERELLEYFERNYLNKNHGEDGEVWAADYGGQRKYFRRSEGGDDAVLEWLLKQADISYQELDKGSERLTQEERERLLQSYENITNDALKERDALRDFFGWGNSDYEQEASSKGWQSMGQETAEELNGRFTALQISGENIEGYVEQINNNLSHMLSMSQANSGTFSEIRDLLNIQNNYLDDVARYAKQIYDDFGRKMDDLNKGQEDIYNAIRRA